MRITTLLTPLLTLNLTTNATPLSPPSISETAPKPTTTTLNSASTAFPTCTNIECITDTLLFRIPLSDFLAHKASKQPPGLRWDDNGCSHAPDHPSGYNFLDSCKRHDFGYRNYQVQRRFSEPNRARIDQGLKTDLYNECNRSHPSGHGWKAAKCRRIADVYFVIVRALGLIYVQDPKITGDKGKE